MYSEKRCHTCQLHCGKCCENCNYWVPHTWYGGGYCAWQTAHYELWGSSPFWSWLKLLLGMLVWGGAFVLFIWFVFFF